MNIELWNIELSNIELPNIALPNIELPNIELPNIQSPKIGNSMFGNCIQVGSLRCTGPSRCVRLGGGPFLLALEKKKYIILWWKNKYAHRSG